MTPSPPGRPPPASSERRGADKGRQSSTDDRVATLRAFRRAKGLCYVCGEKWSREHKCATAVQLHVVQELFELFASDEDPEEPTDVSDGPALMTISREVVDGRLTPRIVRLAAQIQTSHVLMLLDSGSSNSFISDRLAAQVQGIQTALAPMRVRIADGGTMLCTSEIPDCKWWI